MLRNLAMVVLSTSDDLVLLGLTVAACGVIWFVDRVTGPATFRWSCSRPSCHAEGVAYTEAGSLLALRAHTNAVHGAHVAVSR